MTIDFQKYRSITNVYCNEDGTEFTRDFEYFYNDCNTQQFHKSRWYVIEKGDGCNFQYVVNCETGEVEASARRGAYLEEGESFNNYQSIAPQVHPKLKHLAELIGSQHRCSHIRVYGELLSPKILGRVFYGKELTFVPFDIEMVFEDGDTSFMTVESLYFNCAIAGFTKLFECIACDSLDEALHVSKVRRVLNSTFEITEGDNYREGNIIRPNLTFYYGPGENGARAIFKDKVGVFRELRKNKTAKKRKQINHDEIPGVAEAKTYITQDRIASAASKHDIAWKSLNAIRASAIKDLVSDMKEDGVFPEDAADFGKSISFLMTNAIREYLKKHVTSH